MRSLVLLEVKGIFRAPTPLLVVGLIAILWVVRALPPHVGWAALGVDVGYNAALILFLLFAPVAMAATRIHDEAQRETEWARGVTTGRHLMARAMAVWLAMVLLWALAVTAAFVKAWSSLPPDPSGMARAWLYAGAVGLPGTLFAVSLHFFLASVSKAKTLAYVLVLILFVFFFNSVPLMQGSPYFYLLPLFKPGLYLVSEHLGFWEFGAVVGANRLYVAALAVLFLAAAAYVVSLMRRPQSLTALIVAVLAATASAVLGRHLLAQPPQSEQLALLREAWNTGAVALLADPRPEAERTEPYRVAGRVDGVEMYVLGLPGQAVVAFGRTHHAAYRALGRDARAPNRVVEVPFAIASEVRAGLVLVPEGYRWRPAGWLQRTAVREAARHTFEGVAAARAAEALVEAGVEGPLSPAAVRLLAQWWVVGHLWGDERRREEVELWDRFLSLDPKAVRELRVLGAAGQRLESLAPQQALSAWRALGPEGVRRALRLGPAYEGGR